MVFELRRIALLALLVPAALLFDCVGDEPAAPTSDAGSLADGETIVDASSDASSDANEAGGVDPCAGSSGCPSKVEVAHLQLWLRADLGVDCAGGEVTKWHDQSGHARDATPSLFLDGGGPALGPECGVDTINGHPVVTFARPDASAPYLDETMNVDLSFLVSSSYTILIVDRPDYRNTATGGGQTQGLLAADRSSPFFVCASCGSGCPPPAQNDGTLDFTFSAYADASSPLLYYNDTSSWCAGPWFSGSYVDKSVDVHAVVFDTAVGHTLLVNDEAIFTGPGNAADLTAVVDVGLRPASIGREKNAYGDDRFQGKIAEIVIYDAALPSAAVTSLENYFHAVWSVP